MLQMPTQEGPSTDKARKTESPSFLQPSESFVIITQTSKKGNHLVQHMLFADQKKKVQNMGKEGGTQACFIKKEKKNQSRSSFDPISSSNYGLLALSLSFDISSNPASRGFTINTCS